MQNSRKILVRSTSRKMCNHTRASPSGQRTLCKTGPKLSHKFTRLFADKPLSVAYLNIMFNQCEFSNVFENRKIKKKLFHLLIEYKDINPSYCKQGNLVNINYVFRVEIFYCSSARTFYIYKGQQRDNFDLFLHESSPYGPWRHAQKVRF